jgi:hypothetical protein
MKKYKKTRKNFPIFTNFGRKFKILEILILYPYFGMVKDPSRATVPLNCRARKYVEIFRHKNDP